MKALWKALLPAAAMTTLLLAPTGASEAPRHLGEALEQQRNLVLERPNDAGVWNDLGNLLALRGDFDEAENAYARALAIDPASTVARFNLGVLRQQRGDLDGAVAEYRALLEIDDASAWAHYQLGTVHESQGQRQAALERYAQAFTLDPELLFAEKNPHVIENGLVTEALLLARRGSRSRPPAPRTYDEAERITSILTPGPPTPAPPPERTQEPVEAEIEPEARSSPSPSRPAALSAEPTDPRSSDAALLARPSDGVLDSTDLRGGTRNQVQGEAAPSAPPVGGARRRAASSVTPQPAGRRPSLHQAPANDGTQAFGFGQRSTGSLEWRLGPASDEPVPAR